MLDTSQVPQFDHVMTRTRRRHAAVVTLALVAAGVVGLAAATFQPEHALVTGLVFAAAFLPPLYGLGWLVLVHERTAVDEPDGVEHRWFERSASAAFLDLVVLLGVSSAVVGTTGAAVDTSLALTAVVVVALGDLTIRMKLLERAES